MQTQNMEGKPPDKGGGDPNVNLQPRVSFKDMVMGKKEVPAARPKVDLFKEKLAKIEYEDGNPLRPMVHIAPAVLEGLCAPRQDTLVVNLLGKNIDFHTLRERLTKIWKLVAGFELMDIGHGFFMVKFVNEADRALVIDGGPWMIFDHYLTVQTWSPHFICPAAKIHRAMVWIRFPGLNLYFYDESILLALAAAVGKPVKVDSNTLDVRRGSFARVCLEVDLSKPVVGKVWLNGFWYKVEYEGLHRICTNYGFYGQLARDCKTGNEVVAQAEAQVVSGQAKVIANPGGGDLASLNGPAIPEQNKPDYSTIIKETVTGNIEEPLHGDWLIVKR